MPDFSYPHFLRPPPTACTQTGKKLAEAQVHENAIQDMQLAPDGLQAITASLDMSAALIDVQSLKVLKQYKTGRFVQSAAISPLLDHVRPHPCHVSLC